MRKYEEKIYKKTNEKKITNNKWNEKTKKMKENDNRLHKKKKIIVIEKKFNKERKNER